MNVKNKITKVISKEELYLINECNIDTVLKIIFHHSDILEIYDEGDNNCIKAHIEGMDWLYIQKNSLEKFFVYTSEENKDRKSFAAEHKKPFVWGEISIYDFRNFFEIYVQCKFEGKKKTG